MKEKVSVIGIGRLGLAFALLLDSKGYDVCGCDINEEYVAKLSDKMFLSDEPEVNEMLDRCKILFTTNVATAFNHSSLIFIFVPTPSKDGGEYDHSYIEQVVADIEKSEHRFKTIIIGCTVMPGYCESLQKRLLHLRIGVIYSPEFIAQGEIIDGLKNADIVLIGGKRPMVLHNIYIDIMDKAPNFKQLSLTGAEIAKISINCFLTMKIAFANMIGEIVINSGEEEKVDDILEAIGSDSRIGKKYFGYGFPSGGPCLPRDQAALGVYANEVCIDTTFTGDIDAENKRHSMYLKSFWMKKNTDKDVPFQFSYLSYKKGTNILTESYQFKLCLELLKEGYKVIVPGSVTKMDTPQEFNRYVAYGVVSFEQKSNAIRVN